MKIYPSLISANILELKNTLKLLDDHCDGYHIDVMDDHFVPNLTWGPAFVNAIAEATSLPIQAHLMVDNPEKWIDRLKLSPCDSFIFHFEAVKKQDIQKIITQLKAKKVKVGLALNPETTVESVKEFLPDLDEVLVMSVNPGFSGQKFMPEVLEKIPTLVDLKKENKHNYTICMDGGVGHANIAQLNKLGVELVGVASAIFSRKDQVQALRDLSKVIS